MEVLLVEVQDWLQRLILRWLVLFVFIIFLVQCMFCDQYAQCFLNCGSIELFIFSARSLVMKKKHQREIELLFDV